ncbi:MAG: FimB/Mfa2 family fimbrial subunit [Bacteroidales bacterium]|nr:FimB/Mfa2 family fimbrial subunit [Bacteroidales bacterium]
MMNLSRIYPAAFAAALLLTMGACTVKDPQPEVQGRIAVTIGTGHYLTRTLADDLADGSAIVVDGSGLPDLAIGIANDQGNLVAWWPNNFWGSMAGGYSSECEPEETDESSSTIFFSGPTRGTYTVFAIANMTGMTGEQIGDIQAATTISALEALTLTSVNASYMPLTARGTLSVNRSGNGQVDLQLLRPVCRVSVTFDDQTGDENPLDVHSCQVTIKQINPASGKLFPQATDYVAAVPPAVIPNLVINGAEPLVWTNHTSTLPVAQVFPSVAPTQLVGSRYLCDISFRVTKEGETYDAGDATTFDPYTFTDLPIHDSHSSDIQSLQRNQHLKIETRITRRAATHDYSFNFEVQSWDEKTAYVFFN